MAYYSQQHDDFRQGPSSHYAPPLQHNYDSYPMNDVHSPSPHHNEAYYDPDGMYDQYQNKAPLPPAHQQNGYQYLDDPNYNNTKEVYDYDEKEHRSCCDRICCGCCTCCPRWARYCSCFFLLIIIALGIVIGVLAAIFKKPSIEFGGIQGTPQFNLNGTTAYMQFNMNITVDNPNVESVTFSNIEAKAFYPNLAGLDLSKTPIGGGNKSDVHISSNGVTTIIFPFTLEFDALGSTTKPIINDLLNKCGITGGEKQDITINYDVTPNINIIGIPISFTISSSSSFACPDDVAKGVSDVLGPLASLIGSGGGAIPSDLSGLTSMIGSGAPGVPTSLLSSLPSGLPTSF
ncbi:hypothetical protein BCR42DRAFT_407142 [Absidia repens]|uniref:Late embryogenesis abundant protein LEA-2 subgroup domain-containing protein n=1 Tax=Absidia repens TaxID=90262 RepID=A0A1X2IRV9_9FUNG|nr:hypothetical protein BCR42DRAFT_407142 [Absidia repens]